MKFFLSSRATPSPSTSGICKSRSARSGFVRSITSTASAPFSASPTSVTSSKQRSIAARNERAGAFIVGYYNAK